MGAEPRQAAYSELQELAERQGYVTFDDIMDCADQFSLPIQDFDWLSSSITTYGVIVYADAPTKDAQTADEEYDDFSQSDYEKTYKRIIELDPSLKPFVDSVRKIIPPQKHEIRQLKYQIAEGNRFARSRMIEMYLRLALRVALQRAETYDMDIEDAVGLACIGLVTAVDKYDPDTSGAFASYASLWIIQNISRMQTTQRPFVYYPVHKKEGYFAMYPVLKKYGCIVCPELSRCEKAREMVMKQLSCDDRTALDIITQMIPDKSLETLEIDLYADKSQLLSVYSYPEEYYAALSQNTVLQEDEALRPVWEKERTSVVKDILDTLRPREAEVLRERYGFNGREKTLEEVGKKYNLTRERIRQIENKAMRKLRHPARSEKFKEFYE